MQTKNLKSLKNLKNYTKLQKKLENLFKCDLDIEFIIGKDGKIYILQVRKLIIPKSIKINENHKNQSLEGLKKN